jgi:hypothetical protein
MSACSVMIAVSAPRAFAAANAAPARDGRRPQIYAYNAKSHSRRKESSTMKTLSATLVLSLLWIGSAVSATPPPPTGLRSAGTPLPTLTLDQQVAALQQQVQLLQAQLAGLQAVIRVTAPAVAGQRPSVMIEGEDISLRAQDHLSVMAGSALNLRASSLVLGGTGGTTLLAGATLDLQGSTIRFNGGGKPVAIVGSVVQMLPPSANGTAGGGQIVSGSQTVFSN